MSGRKETESRREEKTLRGSVMVSVVEHPPITSIARDDLVKWMIARKKYIDDMAMECRRHGRPEKKMLVPVKNSFQPPGMLDFLVRVVWKLDNSANDVTEDEIMEKIQETLDKPRNEEEPNIDAAFKTLRLDYSQRDVSQRFNKFLYDAEQLIKANSLEPLVKINKQRREILKEIAKRVTPPPSRDEIMRSMKLQMDMNPNFGMAELFTLCEKKGTIQQQSFELYQDRGNKRPSDGIAKSERPFKKQSYLARRNETQQRDEGTKRVTSKGAKSEQDDAVKNENRIEGLPKGCWICNEESHRMHDHPGATEEQKAEAAKKWHPVLIAKKKKDANTKASTELNRSALK
ncbi:hypothetical protein AeMF1_014063 [Aphanomyces euteiches]|nr:hypothetical protein AeMF1_014063 [Aphanomyces euteiches]